MKWFCINAYCCTTSNKAEKLEEYETGQSTKLDIKEMITIDSEPCTVQAKKQKRHHGVMWSPKCNELKKEWEGIAGVKIRLVKKDKGDWTEVKLGICCRASAKDLDRDQDLFNTTRKMNLMNIMSLWKIFTFYLHVGEEVLLITVGTRWCRIWVEGRNMGIKREQNDFSIRKREILCEQYFETILEILKLCAQRF